jgi:hypothetical protein
VWTATSTVCRSGSRQSAGVCVTWSTPRILRSRRRSSAGCSPTSCSRATLAAKDHVNVFLYDGGIVPDPERIITGGHENKTARTVAIYEDDAINESALAAMFRQIIANNRAGGWRKLKTGQANG